MFDPGPSSNSRESPNVPASRHDTAQDNGLVQQWEVPIRPLYDPFTFLGTEWVFSQKYIPKLIFLLGIIWECPAIDKQA